MALKYCDLADTNILYNIPCVNPLSVQVLCLFPCSHNPAVSCLKQQMEEGVRGDVDLLAFTMEDHTGCVKD